MIFKTWIPFYWRLHNCPQKVLQLMPQQFNGVWKHLQYKGVANNFAYRGACPYMAIILFWPHISNNASAKVVEIKVKVVVLGWTVRSTELATVLATSLMAVNWESDRNMFHSPFRTQVSHVLPWNCRLPPVYFSRDYKSSGKCHCAISTIWWCQSVLDIGTHICPSAIRSGKGFCCSLV